MLPSLLPSLPLPPPPLPGPPPFRAPLPAANPRDGRQVPSSDALPEIFAWMPLDATLAWRHRPDEGFIVTGFQRRLSPAAIQLQAEQSNESWVSRLGRRMLGIAEKPRAPPSCADPTALMRAELGSEAIKIESEEDVSTRPPHAPCGTSPAALAPHRNSAHARPRRAPAACACQVLHAKALPSFDGALRPRESELLLQYLTVPYLRIPLLLRFFSQPSHVHALGSSKLQAALDAALFEPGLWQPDARKTPPAKIPAPTRAHLATPSGVLFNELTRSPTAVSESVLSLVGLAVGERARSPIRNQTRVPPSLHRRVAA